MSLVSRSFLLAGTVLLLTLAGCSTLFEKPKAPAVSFEPVAFSDLPDSTDTNWRNALSAFQVSCRTLSSKAAWQSVCAKALITDPNEAKDFFTSDFTPWKIYAKGSDTGLMTGYYEPLLKASSQPTARHKTPILATPDDLIIVELSELYPKLKGMRLRGKVQGRKLVPYDNRAGIVARDDLNRYAIAWSDDPVAVFFLQIQGSGRLALEDGSVVRVGYDDQNGHPYRAIGNWLLQKGYMSKHEMSMQNIRRWAQKNPQRLDELLSQNPSFVFFKVQPTDDPELGPNGAMGLPLTPKSSVAADRKYIPLGAPLFVSFSQDNPPLEGSLPVVAQDTGGAIRGPLRFDYFWGFGDEAGKSAGQQKSQVKAWLLLPKSVKPEQLLTNN